MLECSMQVLLSYNTRQSTHASQSKVKVQLFCSTMVAAASRHQADQRLVLSPFSANESKLAMGRTMRPLAKAKGRGHDAGRLGCSRRLCNTMVIEGD